MLTLILLICAASLVLVVWSFSVALLDRGATADRLDALTRLLDHENKRLDTLAIGQGEVLRDIQRRAKRRAREAAATVAP